MIKGIFSEIVEFFKDLVTTEEFWLIVFVAGLSGLLFLPFIPLDVLLKIILRVITSLWWFWLFLILFFSARDLLLFWRRELYKKNNKVILLEIKMPRQVEKSAEAMENILAVLNSFRRSPENIKEKYIDGITNNVFSLEIIHQDGETHFFIRFPKILRKAVESAFFAYYDDIELDEVENDYAEKLPGSDVEASLQKLDVWGAELILEKEEAYPIKTYKYFESSEEEKKFEPLANFLEVMSKLKKDEFLGFQVLIEPVGADWKNKFENTLKKLKKENTQNPAAKGGIGESSGSAFVTFSPGELEILKAVERNLSKQAFLTVIRFLYVSPLESADRSVVWGGLLSSFNQFRGPVFNSFKMNRNTITGVNIWRRPGISMIYAKKRLSDKVSRLLYNFKKREVPVDTFWGKIIYSYPFAKVQDTKRFYFSVESLASIFHLPNTITESTAIHLKKITSRKVGPPVGLAIFGEEEEIEKFE